MMILFGEIKFRSKTFLGKLCKKKHEFGSTGKSFYYKSSGRCVVCSIEYQNEYNRKRREFLTQQRGC